ncbi:MAG: glycosyltransferase involved in cell wall biosynthesis [Cyclobacteriaceae bacterium]|jgi:glycosyltransferase involved in cell wall biosynthesis
MPNVAYFSNQFASKNGHGIARYSHDLYQELIKFENSLDIIPVAAWSDRTKSDLTRLKQATGLELLSTGRRFTPLAWTFLKTPLLEQLLPKEISLVHALSLGYPIATKKPYVVTIHDLGPLTHPQYFNDKPPWIMEKSLRQAVRNAAAFICVSQTTADSLKNYVLKKYKQDISERIHIALEGVSESFFSPPKIAEPSHWKGFNPASDPYILAVGKISPRKNISVIIEAMEQLNNTIPHRLVIVGGNGWEFKSVKERAITAGIESKIDFLGYVTDDELHFLYSQASVFVYPSLFEGFGLTILEAMASGCPVITSNVSCLPEIAGDAAKLIDPKSIQEIAEVIKEVCLNSSVSEELKNKGELRAREFTWEKCAKEVSNVYKMVLDK